LGGAIANVGGVAVRVQFGPETAFKVLLLGAIVGDVGVMVGVQSGTEMNFEDLVRGAIVNEGGVMVRVGAGEVAGLKRGLDETEPNEEVRRTQKQRSETP